MMTSLCVKYIVVMCVLAAVKYTDAVHLREGVNVLRINHGVNFKVFNAHKTNTACLDPHLFI